MNKIEIINILKQNYPQANCSLNFKNPWELLAATILSAQCTDQRVNLVTQDLFKKYKTVADYANSDLSNLVDASAKPKNQNVSNALLKIFVLQ